METTPQRVYLSHWNATFRRAGILLAVTGVILLILLFVKFPRQVPPPGVVAGPPFAGIVLGIVGAFCFIYAIQDAVLVACARFGSEKIRRWK